MQSYCNFTLLTFNFNLKLEIEQKGRRTGNHKIKMKAFIFISFLLLQYTAAQSLSELAANTKEIISSLNNVVSGVLADGLTALTNVAGTVAQLRQKFLDDGTSTISSIYQDALESLKNATQQAENEGRNISCRLSEANDKLKALNDQAIRNLTIVVTDVTSGTLVLINADIAVMRGVVKNITGMPLKLSKCMISLRPITCVTNLLADATTLLVNIPGQIAKIVENANRLVESVPNQLTAGATHIASSYEQMVRNLIGEIDKATC